MPAEGESRRYRPKALFGGAAVGRTVALALVRDAMVAVVAFVLVAIVQGSEKNLLGIPGALGLASFVWGVFRLRCETKTGRTTVVTT